MAVPESHDTTYGPLISQEHRQKVLSYYRKAVEEGATVVTGGGVPDMPAELAEGAWVAADDLDRLARDRCRGAGGNLRAVLPHPSVR